MFILKILFAPLSLILSLFVWLCAGLLSCSGFVFKLASGLLSLLAIAVMITYSVKNGIILLVLAFLISPMGLPLLAVQGLDKLQDVNATMKNFIHSYSASRGERDPPRLAFLKSLFTFLLISNIILARRK